MPRRKKPPAPETLGGYGAQPISTPTGQGYGEAKAAMDSQRAAPLPVVPTGSGAGAAAPSSTGAPPAPGQGSGLDRALQLAGLMSAPPPLTAPTTRPREPFTAGMAMGPGPGPEILRTGDRVARTLSRMASITGDPGLAELAEKAQVRQ